MMAERRAQDEKRFEELRTRAVEQSLAASSSLLPAHLAQPAELFASSGKINFNATAPAPVVQPYTAADEPKL